MPLSWASFKLQCLDGFQGCVTSRLNQSRGDLRESFSQALIEAPVGFRLGIGAIVKGPIDMKIVDLRALFHERKIGAHLNIDRY